MEMQIRFTSAGELTISREHVTDILTRQLGRFQNRLKAVRLFVEDVNGPRGGLDKQCRCILHVRRKAPIVISDYDKSIVAMIHRVADRAAHALARQMGRRIKPRSRPRTHP